MNELGFCHYCHFEVRRGQTHRVVGQELIHEECYHKRKVCIVVGIAVGVLAGLLFGALLNLAYANHETILFQMRVECLLNLQGEPFAEKGVTKAVCFMVVMPGYPDQAWVFTEIPPKLEVESVYLVDKDLKIIRLLWRAGVEI